MILSLFIVSCGSFWGCIRFKMVAPDGSSGPCSTILSPAYWTLPELFSNSSKIRYILVTETLSSVTLYFRPVSLQSGSNLLKFSQYFHFFNWKKFFSSAKHWSQGVQKKIAISHFRGAGGLDRVNFHTYFFSIWPLP